MTCENCRVIRFALFSAAIAACLVGPVAGAAAEPDLEALQQVSSLEKIYGDGDSSHQPGLPGEADALRVYWFWAPDSPCSTRAEPVLVAYANSHDDVEVVVVHSNADQSADDARQAAEKRQFDLPVYRDEDAELAIALGARMTPEVVALDDEGVVYRGRPVHVGRGDTTSFIDDVTRKWRGDESVERSYRSPSGCPIARP